MRDLATDTDIRAIDDICDHCALLTISYSTFQREMCNRSVSAYPKWAMVGEQLGVEETG